MKFLKAINAFKQPIQKLRNRLFKRRIENAQKFIKTIDSSLRHMGYNRGARRRFWKDFVRSIGKLDQI
ncbi:MAG: hypothetical protein AB1553_00510 [Nitrospirota bacterium]